MLENRPCCVFCSEFRSVLQQLADRDFVLNSEAMKLPKLAVLDQSEVFSNLNEKPISIIFFFEKEHLTKWSLRRCASR